MGKYDLLIKENLRHLIKPLAKRIGLNLDNSPLPIESIANLANLPEIYVLSIQDRLVQNGKLLCFKKGRKTLRKRL